MSTSSKGDAAAGGGEDGVVTPTDTGDQAGVTVVPPFGVETHHVTVISGQSVVAVLTVCFGLQLKERTRNSVSAAVRATRPP